MPFWPLDRIAPKMRRTISRWPWFAVMAALVCAGTGRTAAEQADSADEFVDSVGVNVHLQYTNTLYYTNFPVVRAALINLGVRHVRDAVEDTTLQAFYDRHNELASYGIHGLFVTTEGQSASLLQQWPDRVSLSFEGYESPNEADNPPHPGWATNLRVFIAPLYNSQVQAGLPFVGPSMVYAPDYQALGNVSQYETYGNMHNYPGGRYPGNPGWEGGPGYSNYGSLAWSIAMMSITSPGRPLWTTETGYSNDTSITGVSQAAAAIYFPRLLLMQWLSGVRRTYIYELLSSPGQDFGLLTSSGAAKPAFGAVSALTALLSDPGPSFTPSPLAFTLSGGGPNLQHRLFQKRDGTYYLALWLEQNSFDLNSKQLLAVTPQQVMLSVPYALSSATSYHWTPQGTVTASSISPDLDAPLAVDDKLLVVQLALGNAWHLSTVISPANSGSVAASPADQDYSRGQTVTLSATPAPGYAFQSYSGALNSNSSVATLSSSADATVSVNFACQYQPATALLAVGSGAGSTSINVQTGSTCALAPVSSAPWLAATASAASGPGTVQLSYSTNSYGTRSGQVTVGTSSFIVRQSAAGANVAVSLTTAPAGGSLYVDGVAQATPATLSWVSGSVHTLVGLPVQTLAGSSYVADGWLAGGSATTLTTTAAGTQMTIQERLGPALPLSVSVGAGGTVVVWPDPSISDSYYRVGEKIGLGAFPNPGCAFAGFSGTGSSQSAMYYIVMNQAFSEVASFVCPNSQKAKAAAAHAVPGGGNSTR